MTDTDAPTPSKNLNIDWNSFTIEEVELLEDAAGCNFKDVGKVLQEGQSAKVLKVLAFIGLRRENPAATLEDAAKIKLTDLFESKAAGGALPPPPPADSSS